MGILLHHLDSFPSSKLFQYHQRRATLHVPARLRMAQVVPMEIVNSDDRHARSRSRASICVMRFSPPFLPGDHKTGGSLQTSHNNPESVLVEWHRTCTLGLCSLMRHQALCCIRSNWDGAKPKSSLSRIPVATATMAASRIHDNCNARISAVITSGGSQRTRTSGSW